MVTNLSYERNLSLWDHTVLPAIQVSVDR